MTTTRRPRVAAIGLDNSLAASIAPLCGELRQADTILKYLARYNWTETDIVVAPGIPETLVASSVNLLTIGPIDIGWHDLFISPSGSRRHHYINSSTKNTERELAVPFGCPEVYKQLSDDLTKQLIRAQEPPPIFLTSRETKAALISTTSDHPVALRLVLPSLSLDDGDESSRSIALMLPGTANLVAWFSAFLCDLNVVDPSRVPQAPPRLSQPSDWYTPEEREFADRLVQVASEAERLDQERYRLQVQLADERQRADNGIRRALWADGDDLVSAAKEMLSRLGFTVRDMDAELTQGEPRREDLRLTLNGVSRWQAIVEVKGYTSGTKTNDARQIREHRDRYVIEEGRNPELTVWLSNTYRATDPSLRPALDKNVEEQAANVGAVHVLATDLYQQWALVAEGRIDAGTVVKSLVNADPGLWTPPVSGSST